MFCVFPTPEAGPVQGRQGFPRLLRPRILMAGARSITHPGRSRALFYATRTPGKSHANRYKPEFFRAPPPRKIYEPTRLEETAGSLSIASDHEYCLKSKITTQWPPPTSNSQSILERIYIHLSDR
jgi:hypothetical protein